MREVSFIIEKRKFVIPGELLAEGDYNAGSNAFKEGNKVYSSMVGLSNNVGRNAYVVSLKGCYLPRAGDLVIGKVVEMRLGSWNVDINSPYTAILFTSEALDRPFNSRKEDMTQILDVGDLVLAQVISFDRTRGPALTIRDSGLGRIVHGNIVKMTPTKIPRLIGRRGSMINMIKREIGCHITIGQNGLILVSGKKPALEALAIKIIRKIEEEAHTSGLTNRITEFIAKEKSGLNDEKSNE
jgi:exosome complex component RRP4